jgi:hypothetical protein
MLRITVDVADEVLTFRLEGSLTCPWLKELEDCWQRSLNCERVRMRVVDLTGITFVDAAGKSRLAAMHRQGAEFIAADCMTRAIAAEITQKPISGCGHDVAFVAFRSAKVAQLSRSERRH